MVIPGFEHRPVPEQAALGALRQPDLQRDPVFGGDLPAHGDDAVDALCLEVEAARWCGEVVAHESAALAEGVQQQTFIVFQIAVERFRGLDMGVDGAEMPFVGEQHPLEGAYLPDQGVGVRAADSGHAFPLGEQFVPFGESRLKGCVRYIREVEGVVNRRQFARQVRFELRHGVPQFDAGVAVNIPGDPGEVVLPEGFRGRVHGMGDEGQSAGLAGRVDHPLRVVCQVREFALRPEDQQVIFLRVAVAVMHLLADQQQHAAAIRLVHILQPVDPDVVVGDDDGIDTGPQGGLGDLAVRAVPVRIGGVHVEVDDVFVHGIICPL